MAELTDKIKQIVNKPGRIGTLSTADAQGRPNVAYFGSPHLREDGTLIMGLGDNRTLSNLEANPLAAFFCADQSPVSFTTPACRLYVKVREIQKEGPLLDGVREEIAKHAGPEAAKMMVAAVVFEITDVRSLIDAK